ncbi:MAG TPA: hypothetical protein VN033_05525 [Vulgatibacter sp.]|nr:hypothetical protein [Vulgatibacter sp.]
MEFANTLRALSACTVLIAAVACGGGAEDPAGAGGTGGGGGGVSPECVVHDDCDGDRPLCGPGGSCVLCLGHLDCPLDAPSCLDGECLLCGDETSCEGRGHCDPVTGACVECVLDHDCDGGRCTAGRRCVECIVGSDCESGICNANVCAQGDACNDEVPCDEGLVCVTWSQGALFGTCETLCDPETQTGCEDGRHCQLVTFDSVTFGPVGLCMEPNGGPHEGEPCGEDPICEANLICVSYGADVDECVRYCDPEAEDTCGEGRTCEAVRFSNVPNTPAIHVCTKERALCETDADCAAGETCAVVAGPGDEIELACVPRIGAKKGGERCAANGECATGYCIQEYGVCYGTCLTGDDCAPGGACASLFVSVNDGPARYVPACMRSCGAERDCLPSEGCGVVLSYSREAYVSVCNPSQGTASAGEACTSFSDCRSLGCVDGVEDGYCTAICRNNGDCGGSTVCAPTWRQGPGPDGSYYTDDDTFQPFGMCRGLPCRSDGDCDGWACVPESDGNKPSEGQMPLRCAPPSGPRRGGEACSFGDDGCRSGVCGTTPFGDGSLCFEACTAAADCADGMICEAATMRVYHGFDETGIVYEDFTACVPAPPL